MNARRFVVCGFRWRVVAGDHQGEQRAICKQLGISVRSCDGVDGLKVLARGVIADHRAGKLRPHGTP